MKLNHMIMRVGLVLTIITLMICIIFANSCKLVKPVFLRNCIEINPRSTNLDANGCIMQLKYITNINDNKHVVNITSDDADELHFVATEYPSGNFMIFNQNTNQKLGMDIGRYSLRTVYVSVDYNSMEKWKGKAIIRKAQIYFNDGTYLVTDLGRIVIHNEVQNNAITQESSTVTNGNTTVNGYRINSNITLLNVKSEILEDKQVFWKLKIDGVNYDKILNKNYDNKERIYISSSFKDSQAEKSNYDIYDISPELFYRNSKGKVKYLNINNIRWQRQMNQLNDVLKYLRDRGAI